MHISCLGLRWKHSFKSCPYSMRSREANNMGNKRFREGWDYGRKNNLILLDPVKKSWVKNLRSFTRRGWLIDHLRRYWCSAINIAEKVLTTKIRNQLSFPNEELSRFSLILITWWRLIMVEGEEEVGIDYYDGAWCLHHYPPINY